MARYLTRATLGLALLLSLAGSAQSREVFRCRTDDGALRFGDTPCPGLAVEQATLTLAEPPADERRKSMRRSDEAARGYAADDARRIAELETEARAHLPASLGGRAKPREPASGSGGIDRPSGAERACAGAKAKRERAYRERGNDMNFDTRRRLQDAMIAACGLGH